jgi:hypothetical protein
MVLKTVKIMETNINNQGGATIVTLNPNPVAQAFIYDNEQRATIVNLIEAGYKPHHHTSVGVGKTGRRLWNVEKYQGRFGKGYKMITKSPCSTNFNHLTYFTLA